MNAETLLRTVLKDSNPATRRDWQLSLENNLEMFNGDAVEVHDILAALICGLSNRYEEGALTHVMECYRELQDALNELDRTYCPPQTEQDIKETKADMAYGNED